MLHVLAEEWQLLLFTLMMQAAVGLFLFVVIIRGLTKLDEGLRQSLTKTGLFVTGPLVAVGILLSALHLGDPFGAYRSIMNVGSSWLSREILFTGLFFAMWLVAVILDRKDKWSQLFGWLTVLAGVGSIVSMASIYATSIIPAWSDFNTYLSFFGTSVFFGAVITVVIILRTMKEKNEQVHGLLKALAVTGSIVLVMQLAYVPVFFSGLATAGAAGAASMDLFASEHLLSMILRWGLSLAGIGLMVFALFKYREIQPKHYALFYAAFSLVIAGETLGRFLFYATGVPMMIG